MFARLLAHVPEEERLSSMHVVDVRGRVHSAGDAVVVLLSLSSKTRWKAVAARLLPPVRRKVDREYRRLAARRGELSDRVRDVPPTHVPPRWTRLPG